MAAGSREDAGQRACVLCGRADDDSDILGSKCEQDGLCFHVYCALFAGCVCEQEDDMSFVFSPEDVARRAGRAERELCDVCGERGASVTCAGMRCGRRFHLPCASDGDCVTQYTHPYSSFCGEHRPQQAVDEVPAPDTACIICTDPVGDRASYSTMVCPCCQHAWFHRACVQHQALCAGILSFGCPVCRDTDEFIPEMLTMGIRIPVRKPTWEDDDAYASLWQRHSCCDARECRYPRGREQADTEGPWQLLLCCSCAVQGTHRRCSGLSNSTCSWECSACAGEGTESSPSKQELGPPQGSPALGSSSTDSPTSQEPSGPSQGSPTTGSSSLRISRVNQNEKSSTEPRGRRGRCRDTALGSATQGMSEDSGPSPTRGHNLRHRRGERARTRSRSPLWCQVPHSPRRPRRAVGVGTQPPHVLRTAPTASTQPAPGSSRGSTVSDRSRRTQRARTRSRSPLQHHESQSRPGLRRRSRTRRAEPAQEQSRSRAPHRARDVSTPSQHRHGSGTL